MLENPTAGNICLPILGVSKFTKATGSKSGWPRHSLLHYCAQHFPYHQMRLSNHIWVYIYLYIYTHVYSNRFTSPQHSCHKHTCILLLYQSMSTPVHTYVVSSIYFSTEITSPEWQKHQLSSLRGLGPFQYGLYSVEQLWICPGGEGGGEDEGWSRPPEIGFPGDNLRGENTTANLRRQDKF